MAEDRGGRIARVLSDGVEHVQADFPGLLAAILAAHGAVASDGLPGG